MLLEEEDGLVERIPDTVQALIAARIDRLPNEEEGGAPARGGDRAGVLARRGRAAVGRARGGRAADRAAPHARPRAAGRPLLDFRRERVPLQARADPRGGVRRPVEVGARRPAPAVRGLARPAGRRRDARNPRIPPRPGLQAAGRARGLSRPRARGGDRSRAGGCRDARARTGGEPVSQEAVPAGARARPDARAAVPGCPRGVAAHRHAGGLERDARGLPASRGGRRPARAGQGPGCARRNRPQPRRESDRGAARLAETALERLPAGDAHRFDALATLATTAWWRGDLTSHEGYTREALEKPEARRRTGGRTSSRPRCSRPRRTTGTGSSPTAPSRSSSRPTCSRRRAAASSLGRSRSSRSAARSCFVTTSTRPPRRSRRRIASTPRLGPIGGAHPHPLIARAGFGPPRGRRAGRASAA